MLEKLLSEIEETFQIPGRGLVIAPDFCVPNLKMWENFATNIEIETNNGARKQFIANFELSHFEFRDSNVSTDKRWRIVLSLPGAAKEDVPIGSQIYVSVEDYSKVISCKSTCV